jgi:hypothetical protein
MKTGVAVTVTTSPGASDEPVGVTEKNGPGPKTTDVHVLVTLDGFVTVNACDEVGTVPHWFSGRMMS